MQCQFLSPESLMPRLCGCGWPSAGWNDVLHLDIDQLQQNMIRYDKYQHMIILHQNERRNNTHISYHCISIIYDNKIHKSKIRRNSKILRHSNIQLALSEPRNVLFGHIIALTFSTCDCPLCAAWQMTSTSASRV